MFKNQVQIRINGFEKRKADAINTIARLEVEIPKTLEPIRRANLEALLTKIEDSLPAFDQKLADLAVQLEEAEEAPVFPNA